MTTEEAQKVLDEMQDVRPEMLNNEAKRLFEAIMKIADERDLYKSMLQEKDKVIDLMASAICYEPLPTDEFCIFRNIDCPIVGGNRDCRDCVKQYFENKAKEDLEERGN